MITVVVDVHDLRELVVVDHREWQHELAAALGTRGEQVVLGANSGANSGNHFLANRVERRVGHLCEKLLEVIEQQPRPLTQYCNWRIRAHRPQWLSTGLSHRRENDLEFLVGVTKHLLSTKHAVVAELDVLAFG